MSNDTDPAEADAPLRGMPSWGREAREKAADVLKDWASRRLIDGGWRVWHDKNTKALRVRFRSTASSRPYEMTIGEFRLYCQGSEDRGKAVMLREPFGDGDHLGSGPRRKRR